jgi:hypothetical protein
MSIIGSGNALLLASAAAAPAGPVEISRALRFNSGDSASLSRTPGSAGNRKTFTYSAWIKRNNLSTRTALLGVGTGQSDSSYFAIEFESAGDLRVQGWFTLYAKSNDLFRDPSAWYHLVVAVDTTQSSASDQVKIYKNGTLVTKAVETAITQNTDLPINSTSTHYIGYQPVAGVYGDKMFADVHFVDGSALDPTSFGEFDATTGVWNPIEYTFSTPKTVEVGTPAYPSDFTTTGNKTSDQTGLSFSSWSGSYTGAATKIFKASDDSVFNLSLSLVGGSTDRYLWYSDNLTDWTYIGNTNPNRYYLLSGHKYYATSEGSSSTTIYANPDGATSFHLPFSDNSGTSSTTLGKDAAGSNDWTPNNFSVTAGADNDSLRDSPTNGDTANDTGLGGEVPGNYCTWNPLKQVTNITSDVSSFANGNLDATSSNSAITGALGTIGVSSGKWYWEITCGAFIGGTGLQTGISKTGNVGTNGIGTSSDAYVYEDSGRKANNNSFSSYGASFTNGDVVGVALDLDAGTLVFYKNGSSQGTAYSSLSGTFFPCFSDYNNSGTSSCVLNAGARAFAYSAPSGYKALCTANLDDPTIADGSAYMDVKLYTGNSSTQTISGLNFSPDLVWMKVRNNSFSHYLLDVIRGVGNRLASNDPDKEVNVPQSLTAFNSDGFSLGSEQAVNLSGGTYAAWCWDAGSSTVSNTDGSITSQVRAQPSAGFSIVTYTGTGSAATVGHGLNAAPGMIVVKSTSNTMDWCVYHSSLANTQFLKLNTTGAAQSFNAWNSTSPTSTVFSIGNIGETNTNTYTYVAYCFAPVAGYSAFGSYTGNGSPTGDGPFVYTGFRPRWIMYKVYSGDTGHWFIHDTARDPYNQAQYYLRANLSDAEATSVFYPFDILSNGFKIRSSNGNINGNGYGFIWAAFAESPFNYARAR